jgi:hypothetical protein
MASYRKYNHPDSWSIDMWFSDSTGWRADGNKFWGLLCEVEESVESERWDIWQSQDFLGDKTMMRIDGCLD